MEFKPCPICASEKVVSGHYDLVNDNYVFCGNCRFGLTDYYQKDNVTEKWNSRPIEDRLLLEIESLKADLIKIRENYIILNEALEHAQKMIDEAGLT